MCTHLEYICPRVPGDITDPMLPISSSYIGLFQAKSSKKMGAHHTGHWPAGPPTMPKHKKMLGCLQAGLLVNDSSYVLII